MHEYVGWDRPELEFLTCVPMDTWRLWTGDSPHGLALPDPQCPAVQRGGDNQPSGRREEAEADRQNRLGPNQKLIQELTCSLMEPSHQLRLGVRGGFPGWREQLTRRTFNPSPFHRILLPHSHSLGAPGSSKQKAPNANNQSSRGTLSSALSCIRSGSPLPQLPCKGYQCFDRGQQAKNRKGPPSCFSPWPTPALASSFSSVVTSPWKLPWAPAVAK